MHQFPLPSSSAIELLSEESRRRDEAILREGQDMLEARYDAQHEAVDRAYIDGRNEGRRDERERIQRQLLEWYEGDTGEESLRAAIKRICASEGKT